MVWCALQFPYSARHGLEWWELDPTWYLICILKFLGIVWDVQVREPAWHACLILVVQAPQHVCC